MSLRVTQRLMVDRVLANLRDQTLGLLSLQEQLATGRRVVDPSDNPIDARRAIDTRGLIARNEQYAENISMAGPILSETDTCLQTVSDYLARAKELTVRAANGTLDQDSLDAIAEEVNQLIEGVFTTVNHQTGGRYIFAGTRTTSPAYEATRDADGNITAITFPDAATRDLSAEKIEITIGDNTTISINEAGPDVFQDSQDIFTMLIGIRDDILAGDQTSLQDVRLVELEDATTQLTQGLARVGSRQNRLETAAFELEDFNLQLEELLSDTLDADFAEVVVELNAQNNAYQAALNAAANIMQPSLLDYLR